MGDRPGRAFSFKKSLEIGDAAVINIGIGFLERPVSWVGFECAAHIFMHALLQIDSDGSISSNNDVGAYTDVGRNISTWVADRSVTSVVYDVMFRAS